MAKQLCMKSYDPSLSSPFLHSLAKQTLPPPPLGDDPRRPLESVESKWSRIFLVDGDEMPMASPLPSL